MRYVWDEKHPSATLVWGGSVLYSMTEMRNGSGAGRSRCAQNAGEQALDVGGSRLVGTCAWGAWHS